MKSNKWRFNLYCYSDHIAFEEYLCKQKYDEELDNLLVAFGRKERAMQMQDYRWRSLYELKEKAKTFILPEERLLTEEQNQFVRKCVMELPYIQRRRVFLYYWVGLSQKKIARIEGVRQDNVSRSINAAKKNIMNKLLTF